MKLKTILIVFNLVVLLAFLSIFFIPLFVLGGEYFSFFAARNWVAALLFALTFLGANLYFLLRWRLFSLLEREDWPALVAYLEEQVYRKGRLRGANVRLLANAYLLTSAIDEIPRLESHLAERRPALVDRFPLPFSIPYLLKRPPAEARAYFSRRLESPRLARRDWMRWNLAFSLLQDRQPDAARAELLALQGSRAGAGEAATARDPLLSLLTVYLLDSFSAADAGVGAQVEREKAELRRRFGRPQLERLVERGRENMEALILSRLVRDALDWLYGGPATRPAGPSLGDTAGRPER